MRHGRCRIACVNIGAGRRNAVTAASQADGKARILVPLKLTKVQDLDFGTLVPSGSSGQVTINPSSGVRTTTGGVGAVASAPGDRARFAGAGTPSQQALMAISPPVQLTSGAGDTIAVVGLTLDGPPMRTIDPVTRAFFVGVGGTLQIAANQPEGVYSADFWVTAIYQSGHARLPEAGRNPKWRA